MSTRSVCAIPAKDGFRGRYVHSDGYPTHMVSTYLALVARDGLDVVIKKITEDRYGWSQLNPTQPDITGVTVPEGKSGFDFDWLSPEYTAAMFAKNGMYGDGRFVNEPGYGVAYTTVQGQSKSDEWVTSDGDDWGTEWAYVLDNDGFDVYERVFKRYQPDAFGEHATGFFGIGRDGTECGWLYKGRVLWGTANDGSMFERED